ncbi:MAG: DMT family transporter [Pseudomonadota bacterium]
MTKSRTAIAAMLMAGALVAATSLIAKALGLQTPTTDGLHPLQITAGRFVFAWTALALVLTFRPNMRPAFRAVHWRWHILRVICGWSGITCMFAAVVFMPVAEATAISFLSPLLTMALSVLFLGEHLTARKVVAAAMAVSGAVLILQPDTSGLQSAGLLAVASAVFMGIEAIFIKRLSDTEPGMQILFISNSIGGAIALVTANFVFTAPTALQWTGLIALGTVMVAGQAFFIQAMKRGEASFVMPAFYSVLLFAAFYDFAIYSVIPTPIAMIGSCLIVAAAILLAIHKPMGPREA